MNTFDKLNLRPMERRIVIGVIIIVFLVLNWWFVLPHRNDWKQLISDHEKTVNTLTKFRNTIAKAPAVKTQMEQLEDQGQGGVLPQEMAVQLRRTIQEKATQSGLVPNVNELPAPVTKPDQFFAEHAVKVSFNTAEEQLIDFLYNISAGKSMIRVKDLNIRPDSQLQKLQGEATLVASYQKVTSKPAAAKPAPAPAKTTPAKAPEPAKPAPKPKPESAAVEK